MSTEETDTVLNVVLTHQLWSTGLSGTEYKNMVSVTKRPLLSFSITFKRSLSKKNPSEASSPQPFFNLFRGFSFQHQNRKNLETKPVKTFILEGSEVF